MQPKKNLVFESNHWSVVLAEDQTYLGYCKVILKRNPCEDLADVTQEEFLDFLQMVKKFETALKRAFNATMFNWSCLMNNAYQKIPPTPHVHWHVKPRYNQKVEVDEEVFEDPNFGHHYILLENCNRKVSNEMQEKIIAKIQENLPL